MDTPEKLATLDTEDEKQQKNKKNTIYVEHHYAQANTNNVNKTWALLQTTGCKDEPNIVLYGYYNGHHVMRACRFKMNMKIYLVWFCFSSNSLI